MDQLEISRESQTCTPPSLFIECWYGNREVVSLVYLVYRINIGLESSQVMEWYLDKKCCYLCLTLLYST